MSSRFQAEISSLCTKNRNLSELKKTIIRPLIQLAVKSIQQDHIEDGVLDRISEKYNISQENVDWWYAAVYKILRLHLRLSTGVLKPEEFKQCLQELKLADECIDDLSTVVYGPRRSFLINKLVQTTYFYPHLISCKWRIDIGISSSALSRVLEPSVIMEWTLSNGELRTFEMSMAKFHELRHAVASLLKDMNSLQHRIPLKISPGQKLNNS